MSLVHMLTNKQGEVFLTLLFSQIWQRMSLIVGVSQLLLEKTDMPLRNDL